MKSQHIVLAEQVRRLINVPKDLFYNRIWLWPAPAAPSQPPPSPAFMHIYNDEISEELRVITSHVVVDGDIIYGQWTIQNDVIIRLATNDDIVCITCAQPFVLGDMVRPRCSKCRKLQI